MFIIICAPKSTLLCEAEKRPEDTLLQQPDSMRLGHIYGHYEPEQHTEWGCIIPQTCCTGGGGGQQLTVLCAYPPPSEAKMIVIIFQAT